MKKIILSTIIVATAFTANAQDDALIGRGHSGIYEILGTVALVAIVMFGLLQIIKYFMDYRLKNKIIDKGISEELASSLLQKDPNDTKNINIKWFAILAGIGAALTIIYYTLPLGIHSLAIMAFCIAASFLGYYFFLKRSEQ